MNLEAFQYTIALLVWLIVISFALQILAFFLSVKGRGFSFIEYLRLPTVLIAPLIIIFGYKIFHINFIAGIHSEMSFFGLLQTTWTPAFVLVIASGLASRIFSATKANCQTWRNLGFVKFARASGKSISRQIFRLTITKSYSEAMFLSLPVIFAELVIVEALFNCYGLGFQTLSLMREHRFSEAGILFTALVAMSLICLGISWVITKRLGDKLESYC